MSLSGLSINTEGIGPHLPVNFDNAFVEHNTDGTHKDIHADDIYADQIYCSGLSVFGESDFHDDIDLHCNRIINPQSLGGTDGKAVVYLGPNGCYDGLQAAIAGLGAAGGTVYILPGYTETITASVAIGSANTTITCPTRDAVITDGAGGVTMINCAGYDYCSFIGIKLVGVAGSNGIYSTVSVVDHTRIIDCWFDNCGNTSLASGGSVFNYTLMQGCKFTGTCTYAYFASTGTGNVISNCYFDGTTNGVYVSGGTDLTVSNCYFTGHTNGIYVLGGTNFKAENCYITTCTEGVYTTNPGAAKFVSCFVTACTDGFRLQPTSSAGAPPTFVGCTAYQCTFIGFYINFSTWARSPEFIACKSIENQRTGFYINGSAVLYGCKAIDNSRAGANSYNGFRLLGDRCSLIGCQAFKQNYAQQKYGVQIDATADKTEVRGGRWDGNQTGAWLDNGTNTIIDARDD